MNTKLRIKINKDRLKKIDINVFKKQISDYWVIHSIIEQSNNICNCCNQQISSPSVIFQGIRDENREVCLRCLKTINLRLWQSVSDYILYADSLIISTDIYKTPPHSVRQLIIFGLLIDYNFDEELIKLSCNASEYYQIIALHRSPILFEDLLNINIRLLKLYSGAQKITLNDLNARRCPCGRFYRSFLHTNQCLECSTYDCFEDGANISVYHEARSSSIELNRGSNILQNIMEFGGGNLDDDHQYENQSILCTICCDNDSHSKEVFSFKCCNQIVCKICFLNIGRASSICKPYGVILHCPFCRSPHLIRSYDTDNYRVTFMNKLKIDLEKAIALRFHKSIPIVDKCRNRSNLIIKDMMHKRNLPIFNYLAKLENLGLLGWCDYYPDGVINHQEYRKMKSKQKYRMCKDCKKGFKCKIIWNLRCKTCWVHKKNK